MTITIADADTIDPPTTHDTGRLVPGPDAAISERRPAVRHIGLLVDPSRLRVVHRELASRLSQAGLHVSVLTGRAQLPLPGSAELLLRLERLIHRITGPLLSARLDFRQLDLPPYSRRDPPDLVIDLCGDEESGPNSRTVRVLYDGIAGEAALMGALLAGRMPRIDIEDPYRGVIVASGVPCADNAATVSGALECVLARVVTLATSVVQTCALSPAGPGSGAAAALPPLRVRDMAMREARILAHTIIHRLYQLCFHTPHWRTCWRFVDGPDLWQSRSLAGTSWNVLPDPGFRFYADPFPFVHEGRTWLFVEDLDHRTNKGVISVVPFGESGPSGPAQPVLEEPWHLSYPFMFAHEGQIWMIPESSANRTVTLYRADPFPHRWVAEATLLSGIAASDATIIRHGGCFWMFAATRDGAGSWSDTLSIFSAPRLHGSWQPHPGNPVLVDQAAARPAGAMVVRDGKLWRPVQDCSAGYGCGVGLAEVTRLDHAGFEQTVHAVLRPDPAWPGRRLHTLNRAGRLECIDGAAYAPRSRAIARRLQNWSGRRDLPAVWPG
jgi:hypothetical protein